jgi:hypothetical protein
MRLRAGRKGEALRPVPVPAAEEQVREPLESRERAVERTDAEEQVSEP